MIGAIAAVALVIGIWLLSEPTEDEVDRRAPGMRDFYAHWQDRTRQAKGAP